MIHAFVVAVRKSLSQAKEYYTLGDFSKIESKLLGYCSPNEACYQKQTLPIKNNVIRHYFASESNYFNSTHKFCNTICCRFLISLYIDVIVIVYHI